MLEITDAAREYLLDRLADSDVRDACFRINLSGRQTFSLETSSFEPGDAVVQDAGRTILAMAPDLEDKLQGWVLDVEGLPGEDQQLLIMPAHDFPSG